MNCRLYYLMPFLVISVTNDMLAVGEAPSRPQDTRYEQESVNDILLSLDNALKQRRVDISGYLATLRNVVCPKPNNSTVASNPTSVMEVAPEVITIDDDKITEMPVIVIDDEEENEPVSTNSVVVRVTMPARDSVSELVNSAGANEVVESQLNLVQQNDSADASDHVDASLAPMNEDAELDTLEPVQRKRKIEIHYTCPHCASIFNVQSNYVEHMGKEHNDKKPFKCTHPGCKYEAKIKSNLTCHQKRTHNGEKHFKCQHSNCFFQSDSEKGLNIHKRIQHISMSLRNQGLEPQDTRYEDILPNADEQSSEPVNKDVRAKNKKKYKCDHVGCSFSTPYLSNLASHKGVHKGENLQKRQDCLSQAFALRGLTNHQKDGHRSLSLRNQGLEPQDTRYEDILPNADEQNSEPVSEDILALVKLKQP